MSVVPKGTNRHLAMRWVYKGKYERTQGGLTKKDIVRQSIGKDKETGKMKFRYVSKRKVKQGEKLQRQHPWKENEKFVEYKGTLGCTSRSRSKRCKAVKKRLASKSRSKSAKRK